MPVNPDLYAQVEAARRQIAEIPAYVLQDLEGYGSDLADLVSGVDETADFLSSVEDQIRQIDFALIARAWKNFRSRMPFNWSDEAGLPSSDDLKQVTETDGIPIVYVPRGDIVGALLGAGSRDDRIAILLSRRDDVLEDCRLALRKKADTAKCTRPQHHLVELAIDSYLDGHCEAAQTLAVCVCDKFIRDDIARSQADAVVAATIGDLDDDFEADRLRIALVRAPLVPFLAKWFPGSNYPVPVKLNRNITVHQPTPDHLNPANGLLAVMLATSLLYGAVDQRS
ncbi:hypothetical protein [Antrihabitans sp. YC2-6]|uniref:hypothetical protein n=1 Tax=Antrihabitans sp. YC2-6 TaxID=2799498 RepID=UPI0018F51722|nr:hypothetical protein [Antrihabitans sp. YC2-6]MBJ8348270.1 hypothetical protein [Antrihabitans sp. YC2-6]